MERACHPMSKFRALVALPLVFLLVLAATGGAGAVSGSSGAVSRSVVVSTRTVAGLGTILVDARGRTLYMFVPDKRKRVTCVSTCARAWPPVKLSTGAKLVAKGKAKVKLLGSDRDPAGGRVVTYHGWPLYTFVGDKKPGQATGQALNVNGGLWYVLSPAGAVIKKKQTTTSGGGGNTTTTTTTSTSVTTTSTTTPPPGSTTTTSHCPGFPQCLQCY